MHVVFEIIYMRKMHLLLYNIYEMFIMPMNISLNIFDQHACGEVAKSNRGFIYPCMEMIESACNLQ